MAAVLLVGFVGLLRPDEVLRLQFSDFLPFSNFSSAVVLLRSTKSGQRFNLTEKVMICDPCVLRAVELAKHTARGRRALYASPPAKFAQELRDLGALMGISSLFMMG